MVEPVRKEKSEISFKFSIEPSHLISEIATCNVCRLKRLETRVIKNHILYSRELANNVIYSWCQVVGRLQ